MDIAKLQAWWWQRQGLDGSLEGQSAAAILSKSGWARSIAGVCPYLTLFSRGGIGRAAADAAVSMLQIHELPAVRGCTYVVPAADFALALKLGQGFTDSDMNVARKLGVTDAEVGRLGEAVLQALANGPLEPDEIRSAVGSAVRSLGEEGKKKGVTTTLPLALGPLQGTGQIRRVPVNGRLDQQRYRYVLWQPNPLEGFRLSVEETQIEIARRFFSWIGPATLEEFKRLSGLGSKAAKAAMEPLKLEPVDAEGHLLLPEEREAFEGFQTPKQPQYALVSSLDAINLLRGEETPSHVILDRGATAGLWEYDLESNSIAWMMYGAKNTAVKKAVERTEEYVRTELGDARSFSLDSPKSRAPRIAALRAS